MMKNFQIIFILFSMMLGFLPTASAKIDCNELLNLRIATTLSSNRVIKSSDHKYLNICTENITDACDIRTSDNKIGVTIPTKLGPIPVNFSGNKASEHCSVVKDTMCKVQTSDSFSQDIISRFSHFTEQNQLDSLLTAWNQCNSLNNGKGGYLSLNVKRTEEKRVLFILDRTKPTIDVTSGYPPIKIEGYFLSKNLVCSKLNDASVFVKDSTLIECTRENVFKPSYMMLQTNWGKVDALAKADAEPIQQACTRTWKELTGMVNTVEMPPGRHTEVIIDDCDTLGFANKVHIKVIGKPVVKNANSTGNSTFNMSLDGASTNIYENPNAEDAGLAKTGDPHVMGFRELSGTYPIPSDTIKPTKKSFKIKLNMNECAAAEVRRDCFLADAVVVITPITEN